MKVRRGGIRRSGWGALALTLLLAGAARPIRARGDDFWQQKPPAEWTQEQAQGFLIDSPWGDKVTVYQFSGRMLGVLPNGQKVVVRDAPGAPPRYYSEEPGHLEPERLHATYGVVWTSATIVRETFERLRAISPAVADLQAPPPAVQAEAFAITVRVIEPPNENVERLDRPLLVDEGGRPVREAPASAPDLLSAMNDTELAGAAELRLSGHRRMKPTKVQRHGLGAGAGVTFFFPRQQDGRPTLTPKDERVEFVLQGKLGSELKAKFDLRDMRVAGRPDY